MTEPTPTPQQLAEAYFDAWRTGDAAAMEALFSDDVTFRGPLGSADGLEDCVAGLMGMSRMIAGLDVHVRVGDATDVVTFFDLLTAEAPPTPTANWSHVEGGRITAIRVAFDPRGILAAG